MDLFVFVLSLIDTGFLLFLAVYFIITLSDLECDYMNARDCCSILNKWIVPEMVAQAIITFLLILSFHWILFIIHLGLTAWQIRKWHKKPEGYIGVYDPTEIHNRQLLKAFMREAMVKLGFHLVFFFVFLYNMISTLVSHDSIEVPDNRVMDHDFYSLHPFP